MLHYKLNKLLFASVCANSNGEIGFAVKRDKNNGTEVDSLITDFVCKQFFVESLDSCVSDFVEKEVGGGGSM